MNKLVQKVNWNLPNSPSQQLYMYGKASVESNQEMQEPLEKLYQYENQPDMKEKIREFIGELDKEIKRVQQLMETEDRYNISLAIVQTLQKVKDDLLRRLRE